ncbi:hypothetical protein [Agromyces humatus]|uniref:Uncharacterized protein n=1 Tax=Agromyces humatus TaxID=279573 RepID=A0ABP4X3K5_9MICO|nr:hypothetical protein [Agromyces humatus]
MTFKLIPRYAIEPLEVKPDTGAEAGVILTNVNVHAHLSPDQARHLAVALIEAAQRAEHPVVPDEWP